MSVASRNSAWAAIVVVAGFAAPASAVPLIDFTDPALFTGTSSGPLLGSVSGVAYEITAVGGDFNFNEAVHGGTCPSILACAQDGLGVGDDEISAATDSVTITFEAPVPIAGLHFLDLFTNPTEPGREVAHVSIDDAAALEIFADTGELLAQSSGYLFVDLGGALVSKLMFSAPDIQPQDGAGVNDYALAAIQVVPLPPTLVLLLSALGGVLFLRGRAKAPAFRRGIES